MYRILLITLLALFACSPLAYAEGSECGHRSIDVQFKQGALIEVAFFSVKKGKEQQLYQEYAALIKNAVNRLDMIQSKFIFGNSK